MTCLLSCECNNQICNDYKCAMGLWRISACLLQGRVSQFQLASGQHQPGLDKASACVVFVCNELCLILHNLCSGGHVTEGETEGEKEREKWRLKEDKEHLSSAAFQSSVPLLNILLTNLILRLTTNYFMSCGSVFKSLWELIPTQA